VNKVAVIPGHIAKSTMSGAHGTELQVESVAMNVERRQRNQVARGVVVQRRAAAHGKVKVLFITIVQPQKQALPASSAGRQRHRATEVLPGDGTEEQTAQRKREDRRVARGVTASR